MTRRKVITACVLLFLAWAVVHKNREIEGLRRQLHFLKTEGQTFPTAGTKHRGGGGGIVEVNPTTGEPLDDDPASDLPGSVLTSGGGLSKHVIDHLNLTTQEIDALTEAIHRSQTAAEQDLAKRLKPTASHADDGSEHHFYYARARPDRGASSFDALSLEFASILGENRSRPLAAAFIRDDLPGRTAKMDLEIEMIRPPEGEVKVNYQLRSPKTGDISMFGGSPLSEFEEKFGKLFEEPEAE